MPKSNKSKPHKNMGLSDKELIAKYDTGKKVNFDKALHLMATKPSHSTDKESGKKSTK